MYKYVYIQQVYIHINMYMSDPNVQVWDEASQVKPSQGTLNQAEARQASARRTKPAQNEPIPSVR
jgi:hypothetical protein